MINWALIKLKIFCSVKCTVKRYTVKRIKRLATHWGKIFVKHTVTKIYKELLKFKNKETDNLIKSKQEV